METLPSAPWPLWRKIAFRFLTIYFVLFCINALGFFDFIPGFSYLLERWFDLVTIVVQFCNSHLWQIKDEVFPVSNGSGDSSYSWAMLYTYLFLALLGCIIWSAIDRKRPDYIRADFFLRNMVRYTVSVWAFFYGIIKIFGLQMPFPNLSMLATPLGDLLPMRLSWMFIGYSFPYQFFSGLMEVMVGALLLNRKTITLGALMGVGVFVNVAMLNLSYDIPVKIFSLQLLFACLFLASNDLKRVLQFFLLNKATAPDQSYEYVLKKRWQKITRILLKLGIVAVFAGVTFFQSLSRYKAKFNVQIQKPFVPGVYEVQQMLRNRDTISTVTADSTFWRDFIFQEDGSRASVNTTDTLFLQRYRRGYFNYQVDTAQKKLAFKRTPADTAAFLSFTYREIKPGQIHLQTVLRGDSLSLFLVRSKRHFQLTERQFHWVSEENR